MNTEKKVVLFVTPVAVLSILTLLYLTAVTGFWGFFGRMLMFIIISVCAIVGSILFTLKGPRRFRYKLEDWEKPENQYKPDGYDKNKWNVLLDTHFHTRHSDGVLSVEEGILWHIAMGFNAFFVTDHDTLSNMDEISNLKEKYKDRILVMQGLEIGTEMGHINVLGLKGWDFGKFKNMGPEEKVKAIIAEAHAQGAVVSINHFPWSTGGVKPRYKPGIHVTREQALMWGFDLIEVSNWDDDIENIDNISLDFCSKHPEIAPVAATDVHVPERDRLFGWTLLNVLEFTEQGIMAELKAKRTKVLLKDGGIPYPTTHGENPFFVAFKPIAQIGQMFIGLHQGGTITSIDGRGLVSWVITFVMLFLLVELYAFLV